MSDGIFNATGGACEDAEEMYERGYDIADILEREKYEKWLSRRSNMLEMICSERELNCGKNLLKRRKDE